MIMKRFAARRIYLSSEQRMLDLHVVELDDSGIVRTVFPLREEISHTEWVSGIIVIAPGFPPSLPSTSPPRSSPPTAALSLFSHHRLHGYKCCVGIFTTDYTD